MENSKNTKYKITRLFTDSDGRLEAYTILPLTLFTEAEPNIAVGDMSKLVSKRIQEHYDYTEEDFKVMNWYGDLIDKSLIIKLSITRGREDNFMKTIPRWCN